MAGTIDALLGFSRRDGEPVTADEVAVPGYSDNRVVPTPCTIRDARAAGTSLDHEGFVLERHTSAFADERDKRTLAQDYHAEMAGFLKDYLGADLVCPSAESALLVRYGERLVGRRAFERPTDIIDDRIPASFAHVDYYSEAALQSARYVAGAPLVWSRMMIAQTWRAVSGAPQDVPLAICDRRTLAETDISPRTGVLAPENAPAMADPSFTIGGIHYDPGQHWYYFPAMEPDEVLIFTGYDSAHADGWKVAHGAFDNRRNHPHAPPRVSFEARFYAFFA
jgi:hypothetical protein